MRYGRIRENGEGPMLFWTNATAVEAGMDALLTTYFISQLVPRFFF